MISEQTQCSHCGEAADESAQYCMNCGEPLETPTEQVDTSDSTPTNEPTVETEESEGLHFLAAVVFAIIPALGAEILVLFLITDTNGIVWGLGMLGFAYAFLQSETKTTMAGRLCFWLGIEALLVPLVLFVYAIRINETVIVSLIWIIISAVVCIPLAGVLYLISRRWTG